MKDTRIDVMDMDAYQEKAWETCCYPETKLTEDLVLGLCSEAGEVAGLLKKSHRDGAEGLRDKIALELGDVLWYVASIAHDFDLDLSDVAVRNLLKLQDRARRGAIKGSGDYR